MVNVANVSYTHSVSASFTQAVLLGKADALSTGQLPSITEGAAVSAFHLKDPTGQDTSTPFLTQETSQFADDTQAPKISLSYKEFLEYSEVKFKPSNAARPAALSHATQTYNVASLRNQVFLGNAAPEVPSQPFNLLV